jgi:hypothetical protein
MNGKSYVEPTTVIKLLQDAPYSAEATACFIMVLLLPLGVNRRNISEMWLGLSPVMPGMDWYRRGYE